VLIPWVGVWALDLRFLFGVIVPYAALATFFVGIVVRVIHWGRSPVPFSIPTTAGQGWSLPWIKTNPIDNPSTRTGVIARMALESWSRSRALCISWKTWMAFLKWGPSPFRGLGSRV
jgi:nitrate reductase gamma subunit